MSSQTPLPPPSDISFTPFHDRWNVDEDAQQWLAEILRSPRGVQLLAVLTEMGLPQGMDPGHMPGDPTATLALQMAQSNGYHDALRNLRLLSVPTVRLKSLDHAGWAGPALRKKHGVTDAKGTPAKDEFSE